jgi:hypothetical protein
VLTIEQIWGTPPLSNRSAIFRETIRPKSAHKGAPATFALTRAFRANREVWIQGARRGWLGNSQSARRRQVGLERLSQWVIEMVISRGPACLPWTGMR